MMTPQEVANCTFAKAVMGGYNMASVDDFLDKLTEDYTALYKENAALKAKLKVLADKMEEYRQVEDAMRSTLLAAQRTAQEIVSEAEKKRDAIAAEAEARKASLVADAETVAKERMAELKAMVAAQEQTLAETRARVSRELAAEDEKLEKGKQAVSKFLQVSRLNCEEQLKILQRLEDGELKGEKGDKGDPGAQGASGIMAPSAGMFSLYLDPATGNLYAEYPDGSAPPAFEYDAESGNLYFVTDDGGDA